MTLISQIIPNLLNGVSQQPDELRLPTQCTSQVNGLSSVIEGLRKRPPTEYIKKISSSTATTVFSHTINRDTDKRYEVIIGSGSISVFDLLTGTQKTVDAPDGASYLVSSDPKNDFKAVTIADYTFLVNKSVTVAMAASTSPTYGSAALVYVRQGAYGQTYAVTVNGIVSNYTTSTTDVTTLKSDAIASQLASALTTNLGSGWTITRVASTVLIQKDDGATFSIQGSDGQGNKYMTVTNGTIQSFSDLPETAPEGFIVKVSNTSSNQIDDYYVKFHVTNNTTFGQGTWKECVAPGIAWELDKLTMPHVLIRNADGTFTFKAQDWTKRDAGDLTSNPNPSFVGLTLNDVFFFKGRLGLAADENIILSEVSEFFNFFRTTVLTVLDSEPIDAAASHNKVSIIQHAIAYNQNLLLFSDQSQFIVEGRETLTAESIAINPTTEYVCSKRCKPIGQGPNVYFVEPNGDYSALREYFVSDSNDTNQAADITAHVPTYIPGEVFKLAGSDTFKTIFALTDSDPDSLYVYSYFWKGDEKIQSSWSVWTFSGVEILNMDVIGAYLYLITKRSDGLYIERLKLQPKAQDSYSSYVTLVDCRLTNETSGVSASYSSSTNLTTFTIPYPVTGTMEVVTRATSPQVGRAPGVRLSIVSQSGNTVTLVGDYTTQPVWIGVRYEFSYEFSTLFLRVPSQTGGVQAVQSGRTQVRTMSISYERTSYFRIEVTPAYRDTSAFIYNGRTLGSASNDLGSVPLMDGKHGASVLCRNYDATIRLLNDTPVPCHLTTAEWEGFHVERARRA